MGVLKEFLKYAERLLKESALGTNKEDFVTEFQSYWNRQEKMLLAPFWSAVKLEPPSREVVCFRGKNFTLLAETMADCRDWMLGFTGQEEAKDFIFSSAVFLWLDKPLYPVDYPKTNKDVESLAQSQGQESIDVLVGALPVEGNQDLPVLLCFSTADGLALAGVWLKDPKEGTGKGAKSLLTKGYRPGAIPRDILADRYLCQTNVSPAKVTRVDQEWIHSRGGSGHSFGLAEKQVLLIGCGSLGADIASLLAKAGIGHFVFIDGDTLEWDNVGRHLLGGRNFLAQRKDESLRKHLMGRFPCLKAVTSEHGRWEGAFAHEKMLFDTSDLILSTMGSESELALNLVARSTPDFPPTLFGWTEPFGCAGQGLLVQKEGGCLGCGMDGRGITVERVTAWPAGQPGLKKAPACGDFFQPYGAIETSPIKAMLAEMAIDVLLGKAQRSEQRIWVGSRAHLQACGGRWTDEFVRKFGDPGDGRRQFGTAWGTNPDCPQCK